jgi:hypothetical protein
MANFNPMSALAATPDAMGLNVNQTGPPMGIEAFDQDLAFDEALL